MQNLNPNLNPWGQYPNPLLIDYIQKHRATQTRYEIDLYLLGRGYDADEIAEAWNRLSQPVPKITPFFTRTGYLSWVIGISLVVLVVVVGVLTLAGKGRDKVTPPLPVTAGIVTAVARPATATAVSPIFINGDFIENIKMDGTSGKKGGDLTFTFAGQSPSILNPYYYLSTVDLDIIRQIYSPLVGQSPNSKYYTYLLTEVPTVENFGVKISDNGKTMDVTLKMKPGIKWSDGSLLTSQDVAFTWRWVTDPDNLSLTIDNTPWNLISKIDTPTSDVAILHFKQLYGPYLNFLNNFYPMPEKIWSKISVKTDPSTSPEARKPTITSGPFKVDSFDASDRTILLRSDYFSAVWGFNAYLDRIIFRSTTNSKDALADLSKSKLDVVDLSKTNLDLAENLDATQPQGAITVPNAKFDAIPQYSWEYVQYNLSNPLLQDKNLRQALLKAIDKEALVRKVQPYKAATVMAVSVPSFSIFANPTLGPYQYDSERAKKMLEEAGWKIGSEGVRVKDGKRLSFTLVSTTSPLRKTEADMLISFWKIAGVEIKYQPYSVTEFYNTWSKDGVLAKGNYDFALLGQGADVDPDSTYGSYVSTQIPSEVNQGQGFNFGRINDPKIDQIFEAERATVDLKKRKELFQQLQILLYDSAYEVPLFNRVNAYAISDKVHNFKPNPTSDTNWWNSVELYVN